MDDPIEAIRHWQRQNAPVAHLTVLKALGSTPREAGAFMLVSASNTSGTIGGGELEWRAIFKARSMLTSGGGTSELTVQLGPESGQCCGGSVTVGIECLDAEGLETLAAHITTGIACLPVLLLFGAGHVGRALAAALALLPLRLIWVDSRPEEFGTVPAGVEVIADTTWERVVRDAPPGAGALVLTHNHALDGVIVAELLERGDLTYVGMIGSLTKRRRLEHGLREMNIPEDRINSLVCPIGDRGIRDKRPAVIAALVTAEIVERFLHGKRNSP
ncbi:xanthine dehydrogenase accessory protein XdhC [Acetobacter oeni]|uniref:Xanthine dehydrogenase accessory protein XdhC n=1 Tax=Acetobacter oeni TaxID=304077 RepID=A0A511XMX7_9PROT|nr:xanthine dehydrogenase accessory protein XdhC [Acetobacter oeni]MBB3881515.1 xanthine dehydrogenase accessory factor [Acetobacter oeni]NHO18378.1 xanthine dehydrogenase accessory protein XdhC [Acetobacter oeni]GBR10770.1 xanthine dehydrogenase XdhC [Acetobacter oeni LMG 21952]GEN64301.1 xanthine dehydrogenase accessory protein XdhC [Acetobacter oeni]